VTCFIHGTPPVAWQKHASNNTFTGGIVVETPLVTLNNAKYQWHAIYTPVIGYFLLVSYECVVVRHDLGPVCFGGFHN
jgi:hypothetical protein